MIAISTRDFRSKSRNIRRARTGERNGAKLQAGMIVDASFSLWVATMMITFHAMINSVIASKPQFAREAGEKVCSTLKPQTRFPIPISGRRKLPKSRRHPRGRRYKVNTREKKKISMKTFDLSLCLSLFFLLSLKLKKFSREKKFVRTLSSETFLSRSFLQLHGSLRHVITGTFIFHQDFSFITCRRPGCANWL